MLAAAFLPVATAFADSGGSGDAADISSNAFTVDGLTFDPGSDGYDEVSPLFENAPLLATGGGSLLGTALATQDLEVYDSNGNDVGSVTTGVNDSNILGIQSAQFTVTDTDANADYDGSATLPDDGTVYSLTNFGFGFENIYEAVPNDDGTAAASISDTLVTPLGNFDLSTPYDAIASINPTDSFAGLDDPSQHTLFSGSGGLGGILGGSGGGSGDSGSGETPAAAAADDPDDSGSGSGSAGGPSDNAFTLGGVTYDPGSDGWSNDVTVNAPPSGEGFAPITGNAPLLEISPGGVHGELLQLTLNTQTFDLYNDGEQVGTAETNVNTGNVLGINTTQFTVDSVDAADGVDAGSADLPTDGTTYSVADFGGGFENVYEAIPNDDGTAAGSITDTLVTPFGNIDLPTDFDAIAPLDPGNATDGLDSSSSGNDAFGGGLGGLLGDAGSGDGTDDNSGDTPGDDPSSAAADDNGVSDHAFTIGDSTFDPGSDGWNSIEPLYATAPLLKIGGANVFDNPLNTQELEVYNDSGAQIGSVDTAVNTSNILGIDTTQFTISDTSVSDNAIDSALSASSSDFSDSDFSGGDLSDVASALADSDSTDVLGGDVSGSDVSSALDDAGISISGDADFDAGDIAGALNGADAPAALPDDGTVYSVSDLGLGIYNVYEAVPNDDGDAAASIQDTLVTPFGNIDLSTMFDAIADLDPGNAAAGVDDTGGGLFGGLFDGLLGGSGGETGGVETDASQSDIADALRASDTNFGGYDDISASDIAAALAAGDSTDVLGGDVSGSDVTSALTEAEIDISGADFDAGDIADALNGADVANEGGGLFGALF
jgi:hypothetical protein